MSITRHENLVAWQLARELERRVFAFTDKTSVACDGDFCRQIRRSSSSAPRNIAEGFGRFWPAELAHKIRVAIGELEETQDHLDKAMELKYVSEIEHLQLYGVADRAIGASVRLAEYLEAAGPEWKKNYLARKRAEYRANRARRADANRHAEGTRDSRENSGPENREPKNQDREN